MLRNMLRKLVAANAKPLRRKTTVYGGWILRDSSNKGRDITPWGTSVPVV